MCVIRVQKPVSVFAFSGKLTTPYPFLLGVGVISNGYILEFTH